MKRRKTISLLLTFLLILDVITGCGTVAQQTSNLEGPAEATGIPVIGIAWRPDINDAFYQYWETTIREAGGYPVHLDKVTSGENWYTDYGIIANEFVDEQGMLSQACADWLKKNSYARSNVKEVLNGIDAVFFPGGEDISTTLYAVPVDPLVNEGFSPTRDVSDYLLMRYCLDQDMPLFCVCRGMQMMTVVSGGSMIQDIPLYCEEIGIENTDAHRMPPGTPNRTFTRHDIDVTDTDSHLYEIIGNTKLKMVPSWHHQAIRSVEGTPLKVTATAATDELNIIEAVERTDKRYAVGVQFHPEAVCKWKLIDGNEDPDIDYGICLRFFTMLIDYAKD